MKLLLSLFLLITSSCFGLDFLLALDGPHHVTVGAYTVFNVIGVVTAGTDESATPSVSGLPAGASVSFPNQIKFCCGTTIWTIGGSTNPVRIATSNTTPPGTYPLTITYTSVSGVARSIIYNLFVDPVPIAPKNIVFPPDVPLPGLAQYEANMNTFGKLHCVPNELSPYENNVYYYDGERVYRQVAAYTKDISWITCAQNLDTFYSNYVISTAGNLQGWRVFPRGLSLSFLADGIARDKTALMTLFTNGYANFQNVSMVLGYLLSREMAYGAEVQMELANTGVPLASNFQDIIEIIMGQFSQWFLDKPSTTMYVQPFMVGLSSEALIQYETMSHDPRVLPLLQAAGDALLAVSYDAVSQSFEYYNNNGGHNSPLCASATDTNPCKNLSNPDLNLLIVPLYGWLYQHTGLVKYRTIGDTLFASGVAGAWLYGGKQYSQNYRWSDKYIQWRNAPVVKGPSIDCPGGVVVSTDGSAFTFTCKVQR